MNPGGSSNNKVPATFDNFNGGFTDYYVNGPANKARRVENLLIVKYSESIGKLYSRPGSLIYNEDDPQIPAGSQRIGHLEFFRSWLLTQSSRQIYSHDLSAGFTSLAGPTANLAFPSGFGTTNVISTATWQNHFYATSDYFAKPLKIYEDNASVLQLRTAGMPTLASAPTCTPTAGANTYTYRFLHAYTYLNGTRTFIDRGAFTEVAVASSASIDVGTPMAVTNIPVLANGSTDNYDTTVIKIEIYRNVANGAAWFKTGEVTNGTTTFNDTRTDASLVNQEPIYTTGGVVENETPPLAKVIHVVEDVALYGYIKEGTELLEGEIRQSVPGKPDGVPADFSARVDDSVVGISSCRSIPIVCGTKYAWRIEGRYDELGRGGMITKRISDIGDCVGHGSIVQTIDGVFWWGTDGIYFSDGYQVVRVNEDWDQTHRTFVDTAEKRLRIKGTYDNKNRRIWWAVQAGTEIDTCVVLDLNWGLSPTMPFTIQDGGENFAPTAITFEEGDLIRGDRRGYIFKHDDETFTDPLIDVAESPEDWLTAAVIYTLETCAFTTSQGFERMFIPRVTTQMKNLTNISLQIVSINDDGKSEYELSPLRYRGNSTWGDATALWGDPSVTWNVAGLIEEERMFPGRQLRCSYKTLRFTNAHVVIFTSDLLGLAEVDNATATATLEDAADFDFPDDLTEYVIAFADNWEREYPIVSQTSDTVTFTDTDGLSPTSPGVEWEIRGKPKGEALQLLSYTLHFSQFSNSVQEFTKESTGKVQSRQ